MVLRTVGAFAIHVLTASGAGLALIALIYATAGYWTGMFLCLGLALIVDGIDGPLARALNVKDALPRWDGAGLDFVVDFTTYVFVPAYAIAASGYLPESFSLAAAIIIVVTGAMYFADRNMKTDDNYFRGFPAVWNVVAFYFFLLAPPAWLGAAGIVVLAVLTFIPVRFVHPMRVVHLRWLNIALIVAWTVLAVFALKADLSPDPLVVIGLCGIALYFLVAGLLRRDA